MTATIERPPIANEPKPAHGPTSFRPLRSRYLIAVLLPVVALIGVLGWYFAAGSAADQKYLNMREQAVPGVMTLQGGGPTYFVYAQGSLTTVTGVRVTDAAGTVIPVTMKTVEVGNFAGLSPRRVASFTVPDQVPRNPAPGYTVGPSGPAYRVELTGSGVARVGEYDATEFLRWDRWGMAVLILVNVGASFAIVVVPIVRQRRHRVAQQPL